MRRRFTVVLLVAALAAIFGVGLFAQAFDATVNIAGPEELRAKDIWYGPVWLGVNHSRGEAEGDMITNVEPYSPAYMAGLKKGDRIVAMVRVQRRWDGTYSLDPSSPPFRLPRFPAYCHPNDQVLVVFWRDDGDSWITYRRTAYMTVVTLGTKR